MDLSKNKRFKSQDFLYLLYYYYIVGDHYWQWYLINRLIDSIDKSFFFFQEQVDASLFVIVFGIEKCVAM